MSLMMATVQEQHKLPLTYALLLYSGTGEFG